MNTQTHTHGQTYWLYRGKMLVTSVRCHKNASHSEIIEKALKDWEVLPCCYSLFPNCSPYEIKTHIIHSEVRL